MLPFELVPIVKACLTPPIVEAGGPGGLRLVGGDPADVVVSVQGTFVTVSEYACGWQGYHDLIETPIPVGGFEAACLSEAACDTLIWRLVALARKRRQARYLACSSCRQATPPEWMGEARLCDACSAVAN